ncbi:hypothetical protein [Cellulomonas xiejunii]|uniref:DUF2530 domain-containing protein n=1 Tax=Cellulomonas xiejunii TaxID=2968083 RepID=A0ABY5KJN2_9CELL|nr:hypothetical protein [Cellulomonas xiejunii]MCC2320382.1 hypothetical protein [Cellulomonas xiejunii]UUI70681.1 hypothetical protein NP048_12855 [Cellulomonas xiejunii]
MSTDDSTLHDPVRDTARQDTARHDTVAPDDATPRTPGVSAHRAGVRVGTIVWGLIVAFVGLGVVLVTAGYTIDVQLAAIVLLIAGGVGLIVGPLFQGVRRNRSEQ